MYPWKGVLGVQFSFAQSSISTLILVTDGGRKDDSALHIYPDYPACPWHKMARKAGLSIYMFLFIGCCLRFSVYYPLQNELQASAKHTFTSFPALITANIWNHRQAW